MSPEARKEGYRVPRVMLQLPGHENPASVKDQVICTRNFRASDFLFTEPHGRRKYTDEELNSECLVLARIAISQFITTMNMYQICSLNWRRTFANGNGTNEKCSFWLTLIAKYYLRVVF
jgi:hypothetical protein